MRTLTLCILLSVSLCSVCSADIIFTLENAKSRPISRDGHAVFNLFIRSSSDTITDLAGIDFAVDAADPLRKLDSTVGGRFISGTSDYFPVDNVPAPFQVPFPTSYQYFIANNATGLQLSTSNVLLATLTLDSTQATAGVYEMGLTSLVAIGAGFAPIQVSDMSTDRLTYTISSVPEPSSVILMGVVAIALHCRRRHRLVPRGAGKGL